MTRLPAESEQRAMVPHRVHRGVLVTMIRSARLIGQPR
jgi:hypothetical protein